MKAVLVILLALAVLPFQNCSKKKFSGYPGDDVIVGPFDPNPIDPIDPTDPDYCPRYLLVIRSSHTTQAKLNYVFRLDSEMEQTTTQGAIDFTFLQNEVGGKKLTLCSGLYNNTSHGAGIYPLQIVEDLTNEIVLYHGSNCSSNSPRTTYISVVDLANGAILFDEKPLKDQFGCGYEYSATGQVMLNSLLGISDGIANEKRSACNQ